MKTVVKLVTSTAMLCIAVSAAGAQDAPPVPGKRAIENFAPVTQAMLNDPSPNDWIMYRGNYAKWGYSALDQINRDNVGGLTLAWARAMVSPGITQSEPLVYNGIMFLPNTKNVIQAIDATNGDLIWEYTREIPAFNYAEGPLRSTRGERTRSVSLYEDKLITITATNSMLALSAATGQPIWETERGGDGHVSAPAGTVVLNGVIVAGASCQTAPFNCYVTGHDVNSGEELWRNEFVPRPGEPGDETWAGTPYESRWCSGVWGPLTYDTENNLVHYGTTGICPASETQRGAPGATMVGTNTRFAVRPDTGEVVWRHQILPRDNWDQECTFEMMIVDSPIHPDPNAQAMLAINPDAASDTRRVLTGMPCKNPVFWTFDAEDGEFLYARATWDQAQNVYTDILDNGTPVINEAIVLTNVGEEYFFCTSFNGGRDWPSGTYDPTRNVHYQQTQDQCTYLTARADREATPEFAYNTNNRAALNPNKDDDNVARITAVNVETGGTMWEWQNRAGNYIPMLATGGDLVFNGTHDRYLNAHNADTGEVVWRTRLGAHISGGIISYAVGGRQYLAAVTGTPSGNRAGLTPEIDAVSGNNMVYVFALPEN